MVKRTSTFKLLEKIHKSKLDQISCKIGYLQAELVQENEKSNILKKYLAEYQHEYREVTSAGAKTIINLTAYNGFIHKINSMLLEQESKVKRLEDTEKKLKDIWKNENINYKKYEKLVSSLNDSELAEIIKKEQKSIDEINSSVYARRDAK